MNRQAVEGIKQFLEALGIDLKASDMEKTPERVATLFAHLFQGYGKDSKELWGEIFPTEYNGLVSVKGLPFYSMCEHHLMPFYGTADIVYQPKDGRVVGLGGGTGSAFALIPAQNATGNWIKVVQRLPVRIQLDPKQLAEHPLRVGLSMEAKIDLSSK